MPVDVGGVRVVPVFFKLLPENTLCRQFLLQTERQSMNFLLQNVPPAGNGLHIRIYCVLKYTFMSANMNRVLHSVCTHRSVQLSFVVHGKVESTVHPPDADQAYS